MDTEGAVSERVIVKGYQAGPPATATVELLGGSGRLLTVSVSKALTSAMVTLGSLGCVVLFDDFNPSDGVLVAVW